MSTRAELRAALEAAVAPELAGLPHRIWMYGNRRSLWYTAVLRWREQGLLCGYVLQVDPALVQASSPEELTELEGWYLAQAVREYRADLSPPAAPRLPGSGASGPARR